MGVVYVFVVLTIFELTAIAVPINGNKGIVANVSLFTALSRLIFIRTIKNHPLIFVCSSSLLFIQTSIHCSFLYFFSRNFLLMMIFSFVTADVNANFPRQQLFYQKEIGKGWFGKVNIIPFVDRPPSHCL